VVEEVLRTASRNRKCDLQIAAKAGITIGLKTAR
jgi:hypothetical protein